MCCLRPFRQFYCCCCLDSLTNEATRKKRNWPNCSLRVVPSVQLLFSLPKKEFVCSKVETVRAKKETEGDINSQQTVKLYFPFYLSFFLSLRFRLFLFTPLRMQLQQQQITTANSQRPFQAASKTIVSAQLVTALVQAEKLQNCTTSQ